MNLNEDKSVFLMSDALKDQLDLESNIDAETRLDTSLTVEIIFSCSEKLFSITGPLTQFNRDSSDNCIELNFSTSILDSYEIFSITKNQSICTCQKYCIGILSKTCEVEGPFRVSLKEMTNFDYKNNQCTLCIELIKIDQ